MRAKEGRGAACVGRTQQSPARPREEDDPDRRGPPVGGREGRGRERRVVPGKRKCAGGGVLGLGEKGKKKEREKGRWAGWAENKKRKKKWLCIFLKRTNTFKSNLNLGIQTQNER